MLATLPRLQPSDFPALARGPLHTLQVNLGYRCNQQCLHCHVNAGPSRREALDGATAELVLEVLARRRLATLDLTGGAPELNPHFRRLVRGARALGVRVLDRCNLTVLEEPGQEGLAEFLATEGVEVVASLPCYLQENVEAQRGRGSYGASLAGLRRLNAQGYGRPGGGLVLNLVYNPGGPFLPPSQETLEADYRARLGELGIEFTHLLTLANMPIARFGSSLISRGEFDGYLGLLKESFNPATLAEVMCRTLVSIDWRGRLYDCDFNQMLGLPLGLPGKGAPHLRDLLDAELEGLPIRIADHCYGCTAGQGSSCGGALAG